MVLNPTSGSISGRNPRSWVQHWLEASNFSTWQNVLREDAAAHVWLVDITIVTDCSTVYSQQASECTLHVSTSWPSPGLQAGAGFLYYDQLTAGNSTAQRTNITCPLADWPAALAAAGATLAPCGTASACSGQELVDALNALQPAHERVLVSLACNMTLPLKPLNATTGAPMPLQVYRNVTIAGRRDTPTELSMLQQLDFWELVGPEPFIVFADMWVPYSPMGPPSTWARGLFGIMAYFIKRSGRDDVVFGSSGSRMRVASVRVTPIHLPEHGRWVVYWLRNLNSVSDKERASAAWVSDMQIQTPTLRIMDEEGVPTPFLRGWDLMYFGVGARIIPLVQQPLPNPVTLWALEDPPVALSHLDWVLSNDTQDAGRQLLRLLQEQPATDSDPRVVLLASNVTISSAWWPPGGVLLNRSVTISGPAGQAPVWLDMGGVLLLQANSSAKLSLRNLLVANMRAVPGGQGMAAGQGPAAAARWLQRCGAAGLDAARLGSHQAHNCTLLLAPGLVSKLAEEVAAAADGQALPPGSDEHSALVGTLVISWDQVSSPGPGAVTVQQGQLLGLLLNTTTLRAHGAGLPMPLLEQATCSVASAYSSSVPPDEGAAGGSGSSCCSSAQAGAIAGGVVGGVLLLAAVAGVLYMLVMRRRRSAAPGGDVVNSDDKAVVAAPANGPAAATAVVDLELCGAATAGTTAKDVQQQQEHGLVVIQNGITSSSGRWTPPSMGPGMETLSGCTGEGPTMIEQLGGGGQAMPPPPTATPLLPPHVGGGAHGEAPPGAAGAQLGSQPPLLGNEALQSLLLMSSGSNSISGPLPSDELVLEGIIGVGGGGVVHKGIWRGLVVAVKQMALPLGGSQSREERRLREVALSDSLHHPNIVTTFHYDLVPLSLPPQHHQLGALAAADSASRQGAAPAGAAGAADGLARQTPGGSGPVVAYKLLIVQQLCEGGSLRQALSQGYFKQPDGSLYTVRAVLAALDIIQGLQHLHACSVIHGDMTAGNVLLKAATTHGSAAPATPAGPSAPAGAPSPCDDAAAPAAPVVSAAAAPCGGGVEQLVLPHVFKIADFGLSVLLGPDQSHASDLRQGTVFYMAPEVAYRGHLSPAADVYGFGVLLWEMANARSITSLRLPTFPSALGSALLGTCVPGLPDGLRQLISSCLAQEPKARPSAAEVKQRLEAVLEHLLGGPEAAAALRACARSEVEMRMTLGQAQHHQQQQVQQHSQQQQAQHLQQQQQPTGPVPVPEPVQEQQLAGPPVAAAPGEAGGGSAAAGPAGHAAGDVAV